MREFQSNRITIFREQYDAISKLPISIQGKVYKALMDYNFTGNIPKLDGTSQLAFDLIKAGLDVSLSKQRAGQIGGKQSPSREEADDKQNASKSQADDKQNASKSQADDKQNASKSQANDKQNASKSQANLKQNASSIEKSSIDREDSIESKENISRVSKYVSRDNSAGEYAGVRTRINKSYEEIMDDLGVEEDVKPTLWEFIKHCQANGHTLINSKLSDIIIRLDMIYRNSTREKIQSLKKAIAGGYFDIAEGR